ncbi:hypothetical protein CONLIGDRAFT_656435 [Coniochaeta ligniaria NRRL 30616]|uniref:Uncharacterized protein n=1 Tax=Coniochaeta ligniaria NRRL 30616 TaxID=1408157 RepID=A0A1J7IX92_9PEZI|nr:hypothetical protein CONLIGDRAFT_656435 [Coniochaeta ligniaria NRRL 30616]
MLGKILLTVSATALIFASPMADYNHTHIFNPRWPPHAKFHTGQTITLSIALGLMTLFLTYRPDLASTSPRDAQILRKESLKLAAFTGSIYWLAGLAAYFFPGADGLDPEFGGPGFPQGPVFGGLGFCALLGGWLG